ncbi:MAG: lysoplasmalogenase [Candidatus Thorarchaeota archaeon]
MRVKMRGWHLIRFVYLIIIVIIMSLYFVFRGLFVVLGMGDLFLLQWTFLSVSILISIFALLNLLLARRYDSESWQRFTLWLLIAMLFGTLGDFLLAGVLPIPMDTFIFGVVAFAVGQVFYLLALRQLSPLLINPHQLMGNKTASKRLNIRNFGIWLTYVIICAAGFLLFLFNPTMLELSIGGLCYFLLFASVLAFAFTKFFDTFPLPFKISLTLGYVLFFISDLILVWNRFNSPILYASLIITVTYLLGQLLVQLSPLLVSTIENQ